MKYVVALDTNSTGIYDRECNYTARIRPTKMQTACTVQVKEGISEVSTDTQQTESTLYKLF